MSYCICCKFIGLFCIFWSFVGYFVILGLYQVKSEGTLYLKHAESTVTITRESDNMITHIKGDTMKDTLYG